MHRSLLASLLAKPRTFSLRSARIGTLISPPIVPRKTTVKPITASVFGRRPKKMPKRAKTDLTDGAVLFEGVPIANPAEPMFALEHFPESVRKSPDGCIVGIDEAGRGPVLGPMVYAVFVARRGDHDALKSEFRAADSKGVDADKRCEFAMRMARGDGRERFGWSLGMITPEQISRGMFRKPRPYNLNEQAIDTVYSLMKRVFVDTLGPPEKYQQRLEARFPGITFRVAKKADSLYPIVSAASLMAKVTRDYELAMWQHRNDAKDGDYGSGYPNDPLTKQWLVDNYAPPLAYPESLVRFSWATITSILAAKNTSWYNHTQCCIGKRSRRPKTRRLVRRFRSRRRCRLPKRPSRLPSNKLPM